MFYKWRSVLCPLLNYDDGCKFDTACIWLMNAAWAVYSMLCKLRMSGQHHRLAMQIASISIPALSRARLEALASADKVSAESKLAELIDLACVAADISIKSSIVRLQAYGQGYAVELFDNTYRIALLKDGVESLAADLFKVADFGRTVINKENAYIVRRRGRQVVLEIDAISRGLGRTGVKRIPLAKALALDLAREIATGLLLALNKF